MTTTQNNGNTVTRAQNLVDSCQAITLATAAADTPWAAPVYYAATNSGLYFFSNPDARHITESLAAGQAAGAIYAADTFWDNLMGLQMSGRIHAVSGGIEASKAIFAYVAKFPAITRVFSGVKDIGLKDFLRKFHASLYCFSPNHVFFMDNSIRFGFRKEISKDDLFK